MALHTDSIERSSPDCSRGAGPAGDSHPAGPSGNGPDPDSDQRSKERAMSAVADLWSRYKDTSMERVETVQRFVADLLGDQVDPDLRMNSVHEAHKLAGSLGSFGCPEGSRLAREIEVILDGTGSIPQEEVLHLAQLVMELSSELASSQYKDVAVSGSAATGSRLLVVDDDPELAQRLVFAAINRGIEASFVTSISEAKISISEHPPDLVLLDLTFPEGDGLSFLGELSSLTPPVPVMVLTSKDNFVDRVEVARLGARGFLNKTVSPERVLEWAVSLLQQRNVGTRKVMVVDDDPLVLKLVEGLLGAHQIQTAALSDPLLFWDRLKRESPDCLVLDVDMPGVGGIELCRVLRNDPDWWQLPVIILTAHTDQDTIQRVFTAGADDFVNKPVVGPELIARVNNRLERSRLSRDFQESDSLTGLVNRTGAEQQLNQMLNIASQHDQPAAVAIIDVDNLRDINRVHGYDAGDQVLRRVAELLNGGFQHEDVVARWAGGEYVIGMYGMSRADGIHRVAEILESLGSERFASSGDTPLKASFSGGVSVYPSDGEEVQPLLQMARAALMEAKSVGKGRVVGAGTPDEQPSGHDLVDVALVDDDELLADLLRHSLTMRGYTSRWLPGPGEALAALGGPDPVLTARLILLDVDMPGMNGFDLLRRFRKQGVTDRSKIIMLTARSVESEIVTALELGAFDHVSKPFSMPVLMQKIRRATSE